MKTHTPVSSSTVRYHLRANLFADAAPQEDEALLRVVHTGQFDEVMFFLPHAEDRSPGLGTLDECRAAVARVAPLCARLRAEGVAPSVNVWWTVSFSDFPGAQRDMRPLFDFRWAVGVNGQESRAVACPHDPAWLAHIREMYRIFASLHPVRLWIDDDVRMTLRADLHCPCFCDACLREMAQRTGQSFTRESLLRGILADPPNPVRNAWLEFQDDLEVGIITNLREAVHEVSPETQLCLMHSGFEYHAAEGRRWQRIVAALGGTRPYLRPNIGPYADVPAPGVVEAFNYTRQMQAALPPHVAIAPEIENYPHSRFGKSAAIVEANLTLAQLLGISEMTFSIYRFTARMDLEVQRESHWENRLRFMKPYLREIANLGVTRDQLRGVSLYFHEDVCRHARGVADEPKPIFLYRTRPWDTSLNMLGIATQYGLGDAVTAFAGEQICCLSDEELQQVFSRGVLLDARAAESLLRMGRGDLIGVHDRLANAPAVTETIEDAAFGDLTGDIISLRWEGAPWQFDWSDGAREISRVRDYRQQDIGHGVVLFENALGGRTAVYPYDSQVHGITSIGISAAPMASPTFMSWSRQAQLVPVLEWLGRRPLPLFVPHAPGVIPLLIQQEHRSIASVTNVSFDPIKRLQVRLAQPPFPISRVLRLTPDGRWEPICGVKPELDAQAGVISLDTGMSLAHLETAIVLFD